MQQQSQKKTTLYHNVVFFFFRYVNFPSILTSLVLKVRPCHGKNGEFFRHHTT